TEQRKIFFFQAEDGIRDFHVTGVQTCALPILPVGLCACRRCSSWAGRTTCTCVERLCTLGTVRSRCGGTTPHRAGTVRCPSLGPAVAPRSEVEPVRLPPPRPS